MRQVLIALDQLFNTLFAGWADETISARAYRCAANGKQKWVVVERVINKVFFWQANHCRGSFAMELERQQLPPAYRSKTIAEK